jgi:hypothetical protein
VTVAPGVSATLGAAVSLEEVLSVVSAALALFAGAVVTWSTAVAQRRTKAAVERVDATSPAAVLSSLDLDALGKYVYETLGVIPISEYARDGTARHNIANALQAIERFVNEDEVAGAPADAEEGTDTSIVRARQALAEGDTWQALARLRRAIETDLRSRAERHHVDVPPRAGAGRLLQALQRAHVVTEENAGPLRYAIDVANKAIHGEPVSVEQADDAVYAASRALASPPT